MTSWKIYCSRKCWRPSRIGLDYSDNKHYHRLLALRPSRLGLGPHLSGHPVTVLNHHKKPRLVFSRKAKNSARARQVSHLPWPTSTIPGGQWPFSAVYLHVGSSQGQTFALAHVNTSAAIPSSIVACLFVPGTAIGLYPLLF